MENWLSWYGNWKYAIGNGITLGLVLFLGWAAWRAWRRPYWREAARRTFRTRRARISGMILAVYVLIGLLDSVAWRDPARAPDGSILRDASGQVILQPQGRSLLDRLDAATFGFSVKTERTFSAPFATHSFTKETVISEEGRIARVRQPLRYPRAHPLGTDKVGDDVLWKSIKGIRTALIIGGFTTLLVIPFALFFGTVAGYFGRWVDDLVTYLYSTLASIPSVLLIAAFILIFGRGLLQLCLIMAITSWTGLCRVVRGESLKLRELEFVQAARALGVPAWRIILRHLVPNVMHIVLISSILRFSGLVLAEAVLSYLNIGVGPGTGSWGAMIDDARFELARDPVVWWSLFGAFLFMFGLVLPANLFGDAVRDALDPRLRGEL